MRKYMLVVFMLMMFACTLGQRLPKQSAAVPTNAPAETSAPQLAGTRVAKSAPTNAPAAPSTPASQSSTFTFVPGSSVKLQQVMGDCDWSVWDPSIPKANCSKPTVSQTLTKYDVLGNDLYSRE
ncbi:MAG: hypothetical protein WCA79_00225 [Anaerolineales bacterium]